MRRDTERVQAHNASNTDAPAPQISKLPPFDGNLCSFSDSITDTPAKGTVHKQGRCRLPSVLVILFFSLVVNLVLGCSSGEQDAEALVGAVSECIWNEAHANSPARISNEWLKDEVLMDFLHASNLGSAHLIQEAARDEVSGYATFDDFRSAIQDVSNNQFTDGTPERSFLQHVPHPRSGDEQGRLIVLYLHLFHCRDYWRGPVSAEVPLHSDAVSDLAECYWKSFRIDSKPLPAGSLWMSYTKRTDFVSASQLDAVFRAKVFQLHRATTEEVADRLAEDEKLAFRFANRRPVCS